MPYAMFLAVSWYFEVCHPISQYIDRIVTLAPLPSATVAVHPTT